VGCNAPVHAWLVECEHLRAASAGAGVFRPPCRTGVTDPPALPTYRKPDSRLQRHLLATFTLSGLGVFLFVREITGNRAAALVAGLAYAFTPYRIGALSHLTVLSSAWMPFTLFAFRRYFDRGRVLPLACAALAWIAQNLSSGYYLLFFAPIIAFTLPGKSQRGIDGATRGPSSASPSRARWRYW
jgi:hypothetical protein